MLTILATRSTKNQDTPTANTRLADTGAFGQRSRQTGIEWINCELFEPRADALLRWTIKAVQYLLGLVGD